MKKITIANRNNATYEVKGNKPLLLELRSLGVDLPSVSYTHLTLPTMLMV